MIPTTASAAGLDDPTGPFRLTAYGSRARTVAIATSVLGLGAAVGALLGAGAIDRLAFALAGLGFGVLIMIDLREHRLPDRWVAATAAVLIIGLGAEALVQGDAGRFGRAVLAALLAGLVLLIMAVISPAGLGLGDAKLAVPLGLALGWFGWAAVGAGLLSAFVLNGAVLAVLVTAGKVRRGDDVPFGPSLVVGALVGGTAVMLLT